MNKRGMGSVGFILAVIIFSAIYFVGFAPLISEWMSEMITSSGTTGLLAFVFGNFNLWIILGIIGAIIWSANSN